MTRSLRKMAGVALITLSALLFSVALSSIATVAEPLGQTGGQTLRIPAGQTATLRVRGLCIDFGKPFPGTSAAPNALAADQMRASLNYAISKGYFETDAGLRQAEEAMWFLSDGTWHRPDHVLGQEIVDAGKAAANKPVDPAGATSLLDALKAGTVKVNVALKTPPGVVPKESFYGDGDLSMTNTSAAELNVYMPTGTIFPPNTPGDQRLVAYALVSQQAPTLTVVATSTVAATATVAATSTVAATATVAATSTVAATTMPAATATTAMMMQATATPMAMTGGSTMPKTGAGDALPSWLLLLGASVLSLLAGVTLLRRAPTA